MPRPVKAAGQGLRAWWNQLPLIRPSSVVRLYIIRLRARVVQELLAIVGIAIGVALVFSALVANASLTGSVEQLTSGIVGQTRYQIAARGGGGFDERELARVQAISAVRDAAPILEARAVVAAAKGRRSLLLVGGNPQFAELGGALIHQFTSAEIARQRAVALPAPIAQEIGVGTFGDTVKVITGAGTTRALLGGQLHEGDIGSLVRSPVMIVPLAYAQELTGMEGKITRIFVKPKPGRDGDVRRALDQLAGDRLNVRRADGEVKVFEQAAMPTNQSTALFAVFAALIGFLFALSAVLLTVPQRRRFIADLKQAGYPPTAIVQQILFDAFVVGCVGVVTGLVLGDVLSRHLFGSVPGYLAFAFPIGAQRLIDLRSLAIAAFAGLFAAGFAVLVPVRDIFSWRRAGATRTGSPRASLPWLPIIAATAFAFAVGVLALGPEAAGPWWAAMAAITLALLCILPSLVELTSLAIRVIGERISGPVSFLALAELGSHAARPRTIALSATGAIAVFASVAIGGAHSDLQRGLDASASDIDSNAAVWATFPGSPNAFATTSFAVPARTVAGIDRLRGVRSTRTYRGAFLDIGERRVWVLAPPQEARAPIPPSQLAEGNLRRATEQVKAGGWVVLSEAVAHEEGVGIGDRITLPTPEPVTLRVAALSTNLGWPPGALVMNNGDFARAWGDAAPSALHIELTPTASPAVVRREVARKLGSALPLTVETMHEREQRHFAASREGLSRLSDISVMVLAAAILAMATAMAGSLWQRRAMIAAIKVDGIRQGTLWRGLLLESAALLGTGCLAGAIVGLGGQVLLSHALEAVTGFPVFYSTGALTALGILAVVLAVALAVLSLPGWLVVRVPPAAGAAD